MLNMKQYTGYFGCTFCLYPTESVNNQRKYTMSTKVPPLRTDRSIKMSMIEACDLRSLTSDVCGMWGPSSLMNLIYFDLAHGMYVDPLHAGALGVARQWTEIVLTSPNEDYYVGTPENLARINRRLLLFSPPTVITRTPRSIGDRRLWTASKWQNWTILYSLICLRVILKTKYLNHWALFVTAMNILMQNSISRQSLIEAEILMIKFVAQFQDFYGKCAMTYNVHLLLHIVRSVVNWGPLWVHSTFPFEGQNKFLLTLKHSPTRLIPQMSRRFLSFQKVRSFPEKTRISHTVKEFCDSLFDKNLKFFSRIDHCVLLGSGKIHTLCQRELLDLNRVVDACWSYDKMIYQGVRYFTSSYHEKYCKKSNDSVVLLKSGQFGKILKIYKLSNENQEETVLFINIFKIDQEFFISNANVTVNHIKKCSCTNNIQIFRPTELLKSYLYVNTKYLEYIILIPYGCHGDEMT